MGLFERGLHGLASFLAVMSFFAGLHVSGWQLDNFENEFSDISFVVTQAFPLRLIAFIMIQAIFAFGFSFIISYICSISNFFAILFALPISIISAWQSIVLVNILFIGWNFEGFKGFLMYLVLVGVCKVSEIFCCAATFRSMSRTIHRLPFIDQNGYKEIASYIAICIGFGLVSVYIYSNNIDNISFIVALSICHILMSALLIFPFIFILDD